MTKATQQPSIIGADILQSCVYNTICSHWASVQTALKMICTYIIKAQSYYVGMPEASCTLSTDSLESEHLICC